MNEVLAYFLTWDCYGTWLHGDRRGSVDRNHNKFDTPRLPPDTVRESFARRTMRHPEYRLTPAGCRVVRETLKDHVAIRRWKLHTMNPRTTHVHVVVSANGYAPEIVLDQFKGWCKRRLRAAGLLGAEAEAWAAHGSTVYLWDEVELANAIDYVANRQGEPIG